MEKYYRHFTKTLFFIILSEKEPRYKILTLWSMKLKYATGSIRKKETLRRKINQIIII